jgi:hypothetical protein
MCEKRNHPAIDGRRCKRGFRNHGGLTPAAPGNVRSCIAKGVFPRANDRAATKSGGRQPPWVRYRDCTGVCEHTAGSLPDFPEAFLQLRLPNHGGLTPAALDSDARHARRIRFSVPERLSRPRRADARRSCWLTIVADRLRFSIVARASRVHGRNVLTPRYTVAVANAACEPRRADARRSCSCPPLLLMSAVAVHHLRLSGWFTSRQGWSRPVR